MKRPKVFSAFLTKSGGTGEPAMTPKKYLKNIENINF